MIARRIIRPLGANVVEELPAQAMIVAGDLDYIDDGSTPAPVDAIYVAEMADDGTVTELVDNVLPPKRVHSFAGCPVADGVVS